MVKIFIGNIAQEAEKDELEALFTPYGQVTECAKYKNYAFVHMDDRKSATKAIRELHGHKLHGRPINVEPSRGKNNGPVKLHIANVEKGHDDELRALFEEYGDVSECAIIKNFAFVHMPNSEEAMDAIKGLDNTEFQGTPGLAHSHGSCSARCWPPLLANPVYLDTLDLGYVYFDNEFERSLWRKNETL